MCFPVAQLESFRVGGDTDAPGTSVPKTPGRDAATMGAVR
jgi:hypothetical protein